METMRTLDEDFYLRDAESVARDLLGKYIMRNLDSGETLLARIVETEAYTQDDPASHSFGGCTPRCSPMFSKGGIAYVYLIYGMYDCFNAVTGPEGRGEAALIRAAEPVAGIEPMWERRFPGRPYDGSETHLLLKGPGCLCRALGIVRAAFNGKSLTSGNLTVGEYDNGPALDIEAGTRIGIRKGREYARRFFLRGNHCVSGPGSKKY